MCVTCVPMYVCFLRKKIGQSHLITGRWIFEMGLRQLVAIVASLFVLLWRKAWQLLLLLVHFYHVAWDGKTPV